VTLAYGPRSSAHYSSFTSLDVRATYEWPLSRGTLEAAIEVRNAFNHANNCCRTLGVESAPDGSSELEVEKESWLGLTPIFGVRWRY
jgi:hypothetical protein